MRKNKLIRLLFIVATVTSSTFIYSLPALAVSENFSQRILPLNCIFTVENTGTGEISYVTPETCGQALPQPTGSARSPSQASGAEVKVPAAISQPITSATQSSPIAGNNNGQSFGAYVYGSNWSPIATTIASPKSINQSKNVSQASSSSGTVAAVAIGSSVLLLFIFAFLFI